MNLVDCVSLDLLEVSFAIYGLGSDPKAAALENLAGVIFHSACPVEPHVSLQLHDVSQHFLKRF